MTAFSSNDGLMLATIHCCRKKINIGTWLSTMDYIDRSLLSYEEMENSIKHLLAGNLIIINKDKIEITSKGKDLLKRSRQLFKGVIEWQLEVRKRICFEYYDETKIDKGSVLSVLEYQRAFNKHKKNTDKIFEIFNKHTH